MTKNANSEFYTYVKVEPALREFYLSVNKGSDILCPGKHDRLWKVVKENLKCVPIGVRPVPADASEYIRIVIRHSPSFRREYRHYLDAEGQRIVVYHLNSLFKDIFHNYVLGAISSGKCTQIDAIKGFMTDYNINSDNVKFDTLQKSWYRSNQYLAWKSKKEVVIF